MQSKNELELFEKPILKEIYFGFIEKYSAEQKMLAAAIEELENKKRNRKTRGRARTTILFRAINLINKT